MELKAQLRDQKGKKVGVLRRAGLMPAVIYGEGIKSEPITVPLKDFEKVLRHAGESTLVTLNVGGKTFNVLIHDIAHDPIRGTPIHADFYAVRMDKEIRTRVPLEFMGDSSAVKNEGGILVKVMQEIEVEALPRDLPHDLKVDLSKLITLQSKLFIKDIVLPSGVKVIADSEEVVVLVEAPRSEAEIEELKEKPVDTVAEVKTEQELKRAEKVQEPEEGSE